MKMHRITVVTTTGASSSDISCTNRSSSSSVPALGAASFDSSNPSTQASTCSVSGIKASTRKVSQWRKRKLYRIPSDETPEAVNLDLSAIERRDLPIKLVVDDPIPEEAYYNDPCTQTFADHFKSRKLLVKRVARTRTSTGPGRTSTSSKTSTSRLREEKKDTHDDEASFVDFGNFDNVFNNTLRIDADDGLGASFLEDPFDPFISNDAFFTSSKKSFPSSETRTGGKDCHRIEKSKSEEDYENSVVRIEYRGEKITAVSKEAAAKLLQDGSCSWV